MAEDNSWHLDRRVPIATLSALILQVASFGWVASAMNGRLAALEEYTNELKAARLRERIAVSESSAVESDKKFERINSQLGRLEDKIDRIADRVGAKK